MLNDTTEVKTMKNLGSFWNVKNLKPLPGLFSAYAPMEVHDLRDFGRMLNKGVMQSI